MQSDETRPKVRLLVLSLARQGKSVAEIAQVTKLSKAKVEAILDVKES